MSTQTFEPTAQTPSTDVPDVLSSWKTFLLALPQPVLVLGSMAAVAAMVMADWAHADLFVTVMIVLPMPLIFIAERIWTKREDWLLEPKEMFEDAFWLAFGFFLWVPLYSDYFETPISRGFEALRDASPLGISLAPTTLLGVLGAALFVKICSSFIYYWLHRVQHESVFWWRIHATHHHITKMGCMRGWRTHPFEHATLVIATPIALALMGASSEVIAVAAAFSMWNGELNHSNLPLRSLPVYNWVFSTSEQHHAHHAMDRAQADSNYGCEIILWDRIFGTYCGDTQVERIGAGTGKALSIKEQLALAFYPKDRLTSL